MASIHSNYAGGSYVLNLADDADVKLELQKAKERYPDALSWHVEDHHQSFNGTGCVGGAEADLMPGY